MCQRKNSFKVIITIVMIFTINCAFAQPEKQQAKQIKINDEMYYNIVADNVYMITHYFPYYGGNSLIVLLKNNTAVLIDSPYDGIATLVLLEWIDKQFGELKLYAIVTGFHQDNLGGNEVLIERDIPVYGMQLTANLLKTEGEDFKKIIIESVKNNENKMFLERYTNLVLTPPDHTFELKKDESKLIEIENEKFEFYYPGESHTVDNSVVYLHGKNILFGGCMIRALSDHRPGYIKYANMKEWPVSVEFVAEKFSKSKVVIPGHGFEGDFSLIQHTIDILDIWNENN